MANDNDNRDNSPRSGAAAPEASQAVPGGLDAAGLAAEVELQQAQIAELRDRLLRAHAEMDNIRKRAERDKEETAKYAITRFARDVVTVADNFERAVQSVPAGAAEQDPALKSLVEGVTMTEREFLNVLERYGVKRINPKGETFNPHQHQAMMEVQNVDVPVGTILEVFQPGYVIEDRVLRPAMVVVAKGGQKPARSDNDTAGDSDTPSGGPPHDGGSQV